MENFFPRETGYRRVINEGLRLKKKRGTGGKRRGKDGKPGSDQEGYVPDCGEGYKLRKVVT